MDKKFQPHETHAMTEWHSTIVTLINTPRFGKWRKCKKCGAEEAKSVCGHKWHGALEKKCNG